MTTPGGGGKPTFGSSMGGSMAKRMSAAAAADLASLVMSSANYKRNMQDAAKAAEKMTSEMKKQQDIAARATAKGAPAGLHAFPRGMGAATAAGRPGNGGNPSFGGVPAGGMGAGAASIPGLGGVDMPVSAGSPAATIPSGNGGNFKMPGGAAARAVGTGAKVFAGAMGAELIDPDNFRTTDWLANRTARITGNGGYDKAAGARLTTAMGAGSFRTQEEQQAFFRPLITDNRTGFTAGSAQHNRITAGARTTAALNPMAAGSAGQTSVNTMNPQLFAQARMTLGMETIGAGGKPKTPAELARDMVGRMGGSSATPMSRESTEATLGETGMLRFQMRQLGMDEGMQSSIAEYLRESAGGKSYASENIIRKRKTMGTNTMLGTEQEVATAKQGLSASLVEEYAKGYEKVSQGMITAMGKLESTIEGMPNALREVLGQTAGGIGALGQFGAPGGAMAGGLGVAAGAAGAALGGAARRRIARPPGVGGAGILGRAGAAVAAGAAGLGVLGSAAVVGGAALGAIGIKGIMGADTSEGRFSGRAWKTAWESGLGGMFGYKAPKKREEADGIGGPRSSAVSMPVSGWGGVGGAEIGDSDGKKSSGRGPETYQYLKQLLASSGIPHRITSQIRRGARTTSGNVSYHASGHALDIAGPKPGRDTPEMLRINQFLARKLGAGAQELIYSGPGGVNLNRGKSHSYSGKVRALHHDHVHVAVTEASLKKIGQKVEGGPDASEGGGAWGSNKTKFYKKKPVRNGKGGEMRRGSQGRSGTGYSERSLIEDFMGRVGSREDTGPSGDDPTERSAGSSSSATVGTASESIGGHAIDKFLLGLRMHESRGDYNAENGGTRGSRPGGDSSASGAYQYLDGTWNNYRGFKYAAAAPPNIQDERARSDSSRLYNRYGDWRKVAIAHFRGEGWLRQNPDPSQWGGSDRTGGNTVEAYYKDVLKRGGLPETGDGPGASMGAAVSVSESVTADVPRPHNPQRRGGAGGNMQVDARRGGAVHIAKVEVHLTTPQVSEAEAQRIGKMVVEGIARQARMNEMSR